MDKGMGISSNHYSMDSTREEQVAQFTIKTNTDQSNTVSRW